MNFESTSTNLRYLREEGQEKGGEEVKRDRRTRKVKKDGTENLKDKKRKRKRKRKRMKSKGDRRE